MKKCLRPDILACLTPSWSESATMLMSFGQKAPFRFANLIKLSKHLQILCNRITFHFFFCCWRCSLATFSVWKPTGFGAQCVAAFSPLGVVRTRVYWIHTENWVNMLKFHNRVVSCINWTATANHPLIAHHVNAGVRLCVYDSTCLVVCASTCVPFH